MKRVSRFFSGTTAAVLSLSSLLALSIPSVAHAATVSWDGGGADNNFSTAANWAGDVVPSNGDTITFDNSSLADFETVNNDMTNLSLAGITFGGSGVYSYTITGNELLVGGAIAGSKGAINTDITLTANTTVDSAYIGVQGGTTAIDTAGYSLTYIGAGSCGTGLYAALAGSGDLIISTGSETGINAYAPSPNYTGDISVTSGNLGVVNAEVLGQAASLTAAGSGLVIGLNAVSATINTPISVSGSLMLTGYGGRAVACMGGADEPIAPVTATLAGGLTLLGDVELTAYYANVNVTGTYTTNDHALNLAQSSIGTLTLPGGVTVQPKTETVEYKDNQPTQAIQVLANTTAIISGTYGDVFVGEKGILKGTGTAAKVNIAQGGAIAPGNSPGCFSTGTLQLSGEYQFELGGADACTGYDQIKVTGTSGSTVLFQPGATLTTSRYENYTPTQGQVFTIIDNQSSDAVGSTFDGLAEGATFEQNGIVFMISYVGGDGNDVTLTVQNVPTAPDTGFALVTASPVLSLGLMTVAAGLIFAIARRTRLSHAVVKGKQSRRNRK